MRLNKLSFLFTEVGALINIEYIKGGDTLYKSYSLSTYQLNHDLLTTDYLYEVLCGEFEYHKIQFDTEHLSNFVIDFITTVRERL